MSDELDVLRTHRFNSHEFRNKTNLKKDMKYLYQYLCQNLFDLKQFSIKLSVKVIQKMKQESEFPQLYFTSYLIYIIWLLEN